MSNLYIAAVRPESKEPESKEPEVKSIPAKPFDPKNSVLVYVRAETLSQALIKATAYVKENEALTEVVKVEKVLIITVD